MRLPLSPFPTAASYRRDHCCHKNIDNNKKSSLPITKSISINSKQFIPLLDDAAQTVIAPSAVIQFVGTFVVVSIDIFSLFNLELLKF